MFPRILLIALLLLTHWIDINAQDVVRGKIYEKETDSVIVGINVLNLRTKQSTRSGNDGSYSIAASEGEKLVFSMSGFKPDTVTVIYSMLLALYDVTLQRQIVTLKTVTVTSSYELDSLARRNYYKQIFEKQPGITGRNTPAHGVGISLSPFSFFSRETKQKRQLKKRLIKQEQEIFVDRSFPVDWVAKLTGLKGDSLTRFMILYRPSYEFCRKNSRDQMLLYINEKLKEFKNAAKAGAFVIPGSTVERIT